MMNTVWSDLVQGTGTLYQSRALRFGDVMRQQYMQHFDLRQCRRLLEIGCGPGALADSLSRWYPDAEVIGLDRDSEFIRFAQDIAPAARFVEGDATALPFPDESFDATISNTVSEHVPTEPFYREQYRILTPGGVCLMLSARRGISIEASCIREESAFENDIWDRVGERCKATDQEIGVAAYGMNELQHPIAMEKYGFIPEETVVLGDRVYTDIRCGVKAGVCSVLMLSGESTLETVEQSDIKPTMILRNIRELYEIVSED